MSRPSPRDHAREFHPHELFFSTTDRRGVITFGNDVFTRISGYPADRLIGAPHNVIRHPDMPRAVFRLLWDYLLAGRPICAYVKNLAADGSYYWVLALVAPIDEGFLSIRLKPSTPLLETVAGVYREMLRIEESLESRGKPSADCMNASTDYLLQTLSSLGHRSYDPFMQQVLLAEVTGRKRAIPPSSRPVPVNSRSEIAGLRGECGVIEGAVASLFAKLDTFFSLEKALAEKTHFVRTLGQNLQLQSLNAQVRAAGLRDDGRTLQVIAEQMSDSSRGTSDSAAGICTDIDEVTAALRDAAFRIATSDLNVEMTGTFLDELQQSSADPSAVRHRIAQLAEVLAANLDLTCDRVAAASHAIRRFEQRLTSFLREIRTLEILHVTGKVEAIRCPDGHNVSATFREVYTQTQSARHELSTLADLLSTARVAPPHKPTLDASLRSLRSAA